MEQKILENTETTGREFYVKGTNFVVQLTGHAGGTWSLEHQAPDATWIDLDEDWDGDGERAVIASQGRPYRITGGSAGAEAWANDNREAFYG